jgi:drug/metabolite transporter (DMT)-like permease
MTARDIGSVMVLGLLGSVLFTLFILEGARRTSGADAGIVTATVPVVVAVAGVVLKRERLTWAQAAMVVLAAAGIGLLQATGGGASTATGLVLVFLAVLCEASFVVASRRISAVYGPIRLSYAVAGVSLVATLPLPWLWTAPVIEPLTALPWSMWVAAVWYALTASMLCTVLWYRGAPHVPTWMAGLATAALPVSALVVSALVAGEPIGWHRLAGAALVIGAIVLAAASPARTTSSGRTHA